MLKLCQLIAVLLAVVLIVICEPAELKVAAPWTTVPPVGLAFAGHSQYGQASKDNATKAAGRRGLAELLFINTGPWSEFNPLKQFWGDIGATN